MPPGRRKKPGYNWTEGIDTPGPTLPNYTFPKRVVPDYTSQIPRNIPNKPDYTSQIPRSLGPMIPAQLTPVNYRNPGSYGGSSGSGGSGGMGGSVPVGVAGYNPITADLSKNPYPAEYDKLLAFVQSSLASRTADFDAVKTSMRGQQGQANQQMYDAYMGSRKESDASSTALGVDPLVVSAARDLAMRKSQENSDQGLADNLAWIDKAKVLQGDELGYASRSIAANKLSKSLGWEEAERGRVHDINARGQEAYQEALMAALEAQSAGQSAGRSGRKGSRGSSDEGKEPVVTLTEVLENSGLDLATFKELERTNPAAAALFKNYTNLATTEESATTLAQKAFNEMSANPLLNRKDERIGNWRPMQQLLESSKRGRTRKLNKDKQLTEIVLAALSGLQGKMGSPRSETRIVTKSG